MNYKRGDIVYVENKNAVGREMDKDRPAIIVSCQVLNDTSPLVSVVYLSTSNTKGLPEHVTIRSTPSVSVALCEAVYTVDKSRIIRNVGQVTADELQRVNIGVAIGLELDLGHLQAPNSDDKEPDIKVLAELEETQEKLKMAKQRMTLMRGMYDELLDRIMVTE